MTAPFDLATTDRLLTTTRSVRKRLDLDAPVELEEIQTCIAHLPFEREAAGPLGIPPTVRQVALLPVAKCTGDSFKPGRRRDVREITYWDGWKQTRGGS